MIKGLVRNLVSLWLDVLAPAFIVLYCFCKFFLSRAFGELVSIMSLPFCFWLNGIELRLLPSFLLPSFSLATCPELGLVLPNLPYSFWYYTWSSSTDLSPPLTLPALFSYFYVSNIFPDVLIACFYLIVACKLSADSGFVSCWFWSGLDRIC